MLKVKEAVIVEGRYDKAKLSNLIDALIIETNGFEIFKDKEKTAFIRRLAEERGIILLTDSDHSGFIIRNYVSNGIPKDRIKQIYIPDVYGKEKRKQAPSSEGKLGVEGIDDEILLDLFKKASVTAFTDESDAFLTPSDLLDLKLAGCDNSSENKKKLLKSLGLPEHLSTKAMLKYINSSYSEEDFIRHYNSVFK